MWLLLVCVFGGGGEGVLCVRSLSSQKYFDLKIYTKYKQFADSVIRVQTESLVLSCVVCVFFFLFVVYRGEGEKNPKHFLSSLAYKNPNESQLIIEIIDN